MNNGPRTLAGVIAILGVMLTAAPASAQNGWTFSGVAFTPREGWCPEATQQGGSPTLEVRPCGEAYPYMSIAVGIPPDGKGTTWDLAKLAQNFVETMEGAKGPAIFAEAVAPTYGTCVKQSLVVERNAVPQVYGSSVVAKFSCTKDGKTESIDFSNYTVYSQTRAGAVWVVTFDYPQGPMTPGDHAMIKAAVDRIASN